MMNFQQTEKLLDLLDESGVDHVIFKDRTSEYAYHLPPCDSDAICFHKMNKCPWFFDRLAVCDTDTTSEPFYKDWYLTVAYHS